jgi:hypothetical protein
MTRPAADADTFRCPGDARRRKLRAAVVLTFPIAFALHDLEELLTAAAWGRRAPGVIRRRWPHAPDRVAELAAVTGPQMAVAIGVVASGVAAATRSGCATWTGTSGSFQRRWRPTPVMARRTCSSQRSCATTRPAWRRCRW